MASVARAVPRPPSSSSSSSRSSWPSLSQRISVGGVPASSARRRLRSRSIFSGGKKPNWRSARSSRSSRRGKAAIRGAPLLGRLQDGFAAGHVLAQPARHVEVMLRLVPRPLHFVASGPGGLLDDDACRTAAARAACGGGGGTAALARRPCVGPPPPSSRTPRVLIGSTVISVSSCSERWVVRSKPRMDEMSSPHHSSRAGAAMPKPYTSTMPPRTLNSATSVTVGTRRYPIRSSVRATSAGGRRSPVASRSRSRSSAAGIRVRSAVARAVVTSSRSRPCSSASIVSARSPAIS